MAEHELITLTKRLRYDLTAAQTKLNEILRLLGDLGLETPEPLMPVVCRHCGLKTKGPRSLAEHLYVSHEGPEPEHWLEAEKRSSHEHNPA